MFLAMLLLSAELSGQVSYLDSVDASIVAKVDNDISVEASSASLVMILLQLRFLLKTLSAFSADASIVTKMDAADDSLETRISTEESTMDCC